MCLFTDEKALADSKAAYEYEQTFPTANWDYWEDLREDLCVFVNQKSNWV